VLVDPGSNVELVYERLVKAANLAAMPLDQLDHPLEIGMGNDTVLEATAVASVPLQLANDYKDTINCYMCPNLAKDVDLLLSKTWLARLQRDSNTPVDINWETNILKFHWKGQPVTLFPQMTSDRKHPDVLTPKQFRKAEEI
jgi:hypothetical protein